MESGGSNGNGNGNGGGGAPNGASGPVVPFERAQRERLAATRSGTTTALAPANPMQTMEKSFQAPALRQGERELVIAGCRALNGPRRFD